MPERARRKASLIRPGMEGRFGTAASYAGYAAPRSVFAFFYLSAASTAAACPSGLMPVMIALIFPSGLITNVVRSIPMYFRPYMLFSFRTPNLMATAFSVSASKE